MSPLHARTSRRALLAGTAALIACGLTACGSSSGGSAGASAAGSAGNGASFTPVTIKSALGDATIAAKPKRVVTLGQGSAETAIALGVTPVGIESYPWGSDPKTGYLPWIYDAVKAKNGTLPKQFTGGTELDIESILELDPDVILAPWSGITQAQYDKLKDIAPTVAYPDKAWSTDWDQQITTIGKALGEPEKAKSLIGTIDSQLAGVAKQHPKYADTSFVYTYTDGPGTLGVFLPTEQRSAMLSKMGLKVDPVVKTLKEKDGTDSAVIGLENADKISSADLMFTFYSDAKTKKSIEAQPLYAKIPAVKRGSVVTSDDPSFVTASSMINPLTVPWVIKRYPPMIDAAIAKVG
ncbi:iron-siderophore ABC transporter substrate-binding protein [Flexivirga sp. ID2601S]|uniref:Iron-siderophore ABC transporter substrate-binding protein n=1 Tax=Flexivirga aerilata TaxID=1656889 RepID=A0A849ACR2_9MICO|nr:iron-siderophore ABC transporter substrate-binding protein [Flexivirga aerilata]NNG38259.1 iron-siderophore ABC transporter substrate-binding protein [Flexivirga aerilata]